jgi:hypothetical protein
LHADYHTETLARVEEHPNRKYFVLKSIIIQNLYGVDIMDEAVEICKLRLFLKLVAQVDAAEKIEPLPDIDFNIRAGNTLVGFATREAVKEAISKEQAGKLKQDKLVFGDEADALKKIEEKADDVDRLFTLFREQQTALGGTVTAADKEALRKRLRALEDELNRLLAVEYAVKSSDTAEYQRWLKSHQPFHWFVEFYGIMKHGGFDVIIGNPPYVEYHTIRHSYQVRGFCTESCGNLYAYVLEQCFTLSVQQGRIGMIVQLSAICTDRMQALQALYLANSTKLWASCFDDRPGKLFDGLEHIRATILLSKSVSGAVSDVLTTNLMRWPTETRQTLFPRLHYGSVTSMSMTGSFPKASDRQLAKLLNRMWSLPSRLEKVYDPQSQHIVHYYRSPLYWIRAMDFLPHFASESAQRSVHHFKDYPVADSSMAAVVGSLINSTTFYIWFVAYGNGRNVTLRDIRSFPVPDSMFAPKTARSFRSLFARLMKDYKTHSVIRQRRDGIEFQEFDPSKSKPLMDEIDAALAPHFGFTDEELDFIINYDIKYRMGGGDDDDE